MRPEVRPGQGPLLLAQPHGGIEIPDAIATRLNRNGHARADTDWHIARLYDGLAAEATVVRTPLHRYVIDVNRDPADQTLYPGQNTTSLCPTTTFDGIEIYREGQAPNADEIRERQRRYHQPYHDALRQQIERIRQRHGYVILYDCHSIRSRISYLFDGKLPDFNIGSNSGRSCDATIEDSVFSVCRAATEYSSVCNGRFKGGWTTRHYGAPERDQHAIQMELAQCSYMHERPPWTYDESKAAHLRVILASILQKLAQLFD